MLWDDSKGNWEQRMMDTKQGWTSMPVLWSRWASMLLSLLSLSPHLSSQPSQPQEHFYVLPSLYVGGFLSSSLANCWIIVCRAILVLEALCLHVIFGIQLVMYKTFQWFLLSFYFHFYLFKVTEKCIVYSCLFKPNKGVVLSKYQILPSLFGIIS